MSEALGERVSPKSQSRTKKTKRAHKRAAPVIVGIGASAGGLEALQAFVRSLKPGGQFTYVVAQHLSPHHRSMLMELLARETELPVVELTRAQLPQADTIYITPPNKHVEVSAGGLTVRTPKLKIGPQPSVDVFFASLALECGERAIGIVFSGTGSDGARGVQAIKAAGGITCAQDDSAKYDGMPRAAMATGCVDLVLSPAEVGEELPLLLDQGERELLQDKSGFSPGTYEEIVSIIRTRTQIDFSDYRSSTILRRISRRMKMLRLETLEDYRDYLKSESPEADILTGELLIRVTSFFRDEPAFDKLNRIVEKIVRSNSNGGDIRAWVPGCATGEEAFSLAMLFLEAIRKSGSGARLQIFATDLDEKALALARRGVFPPSIGEQMKAGLLRRYFAPNGSDYAVQNAIREQIIFSKHNVIEDPPFSKLDLISCRNLFIYLNTTLQRRVLERFHYALKPGGCLFLGKSESVGERDDLFSTIDSSAKIYRAAAGVSSPFRPNNPKIRVETAAVSPPPHQARMRRRESQSYEAMAHCFAPPAVVVNRDNKPINISGLVAPYLQVPTGSSNFDIFSLVRDHLRPELRALLAQSRREKVIVRSRSHTAEHEGDRWQYRIEVHPFHDPQTGEDLDVVGFVTLRALVEGEPGEVIADTSPSDQRVEELEHELASMREHLQTMVEELETSNEELQSLNEELQSSNEELQSTNEELETSNEELQSTNEELTTVNEEMAVKSQELHETNAYMSNVLESMGHPVIVTDLKMNVMRFNSAATELFHVDERDIGHAVTSLKPKFRMPNLRDFIDHAMRSFRSKTQRVRAGKQSYQLSVHPCTDDDDRVIGSVVVFDNVTKLAESNARLRESEREMARLSEQQTAALDSLPAHIALLDHDGIIVAVNEEWRRFGEVNAFEGNAFGLGRNYISICESASGECAEEAGLVARKLRDVLTGRSLQVEVRYPCHSPNEQRWFKCIARAVRSKNQGYGAVVMHIDETDRVLVEESMITARQMAEEASSAKSIFLANMSHELRTPLNAIIGFSEMQLKEIYGPHGHPKYLEYAKDVHGEATQLLGMIDEILDLSKVEAGKHEIHPTGIDLRQFQKALFKVFEQSIARKNLLLSAHFPRDLPLLYADKALLRRMVSNLLANAIKFTPVNGSIDLKVSVEPSGWLAIAVQDNGVGIEKAQLDRIVEPFSQIRSTLTSSNSGVGLGLALVNSLLRLHGGKLEIESEPDSGTNVTLLFPPERVINEEMIATG